MLNDATEPGAGFGVDTNRVTLIGRNGKQEELPLMSKADVAEVILDRVERGAEWTLRTCSGATSSSAASSANRSSCSMRCTSRRSCGCSARREGPATDAAAAAASARLRSAAAQDWRASLRDAGATCSTPPMNADPPVARTRTSFPGSAKRRLHRRRSTIPHDMAFKHGHRRGAATMPSSYPARSAKLASLDEIAQAVGKCTRCPLYATATNPVPGEGNPKADLMCVGEAPGATEDETGRPFVGQAGQLLTKILAAIDLTREDVFICNVLKHRPPGNRNPLPEEVEACSPTSFGSSS